MRLPITENRKPKVMEDRSASDKKCSREIVLKKAVKFHVKFGESVKIYCEISFPILMPHTLKTLSDVFWDTKIILLDVGM